MTDPRNEPRRGLHAVVPESSHEAWHQFAANHGPSVSAIRRGQPPEAAVILTDLERIVLALVFTAALILLIGFAIDDWLYRRRLHSPGNWARAASDLSHRITLERQAREHAESLAATAHDQLANHVGHLAAEIERLRAQVATRPPSAEPTVRLGQAAAGRTARLARLDPSLPLHTGGVINHTNTRVGEGR